ncbi:MAG: hypothetical protein M0P69_03530 [Bacteroidales bacterium]|nr:hypothetical protein [Bacteroidales bacterium]MDD2569958.1 hypothetical protein [Bacteroidales bacterium]MDD2814089.1 hypothetical protein [Bacteroidales bacterium]MDD3810688.1 hypothetical protein [Bacteroidales bacterium]MDD4811781.1 hypothetical protein [Bacteroidales bacterium]
MLITVIALSLVLVLIAVVGLSLNIIFRKNGQFPETEIETNPDMKKLGITCARHDDLQAHQQSRLGKDHLDHGTGHHGCGSGCCCSSIDSCR